MNGLQIPVSKDMNTAEISVWFRRYSELFTAIEISSGCIRADKPPRAQPSKKIVVLEKNLKEE